MDKDNLITEQEVGNNLELNANNSQNNDSPFAAQSIDNQHSLQSVSVPPSGGEGSITWTASEYIYHQKDIKWYSIAIVSTIVIAAILWFLLANIIGAVVIIVAGILIIYTAGKKPRDVQYKITGNSLFVGEKEFTFDQFSSFATIKQAAFSGLVFSPLKRFGLYLTVYYDPADEAKILQLLSNRLPLEDVHRDWIEDLLWKIKY